MSIKSTEVITNAQKMIDDGYVYVYGAKGTKLTKTQIENLAKMYPSVYTNTIKSLALKKVGKTMIDCSGFVCKAAKISHIGSSQLITATKKKYAVTDTKNMKTGMGLWRQGHVGLLGKINGVWYVLEAQSTATDLKKTPFDIRGKAFTYMFEIPGVDYTEEPTKYVKIVETKGIEKVKVSTKGSALNCRKQPNIVSGIVGKFANGTVLKVLDSKNDNWYLVEGIAKNKVKIKGYVSTKYLKVTK